MKAKNISLCVLQMILCVVLEFFLTYRCVFFSSEHQRGASSTIGVSGAVGYKCDNNYHNNNTVITIEETNIKIINTTTTTPSKTTRNTKNNATTSKTSISHTNDRNT